MNRSQRSRYHSLQTPQAVVWTVVACCLLLVAAAQRAQAVQAYSFETDLQGFAANGVFIAPLTQDTIGATHGTKSLKMSLDKRATYVGALAGNLDSTIIGDPPGVHSVSFDLTLEATFPSGPGTYVDIFIVFFGVQNGTTEPGLEISFQSNLVGIRDLAPGTHKISMELNSAFHPVTFDGPMPFNDIFGVEGVNDVIPTGFQITVNKSTQAPWVGYIDNVEFFSSAAAPGDFDLDGDVDGNDFLVWQRGETSPPLDPAALAEWKANYGAGGGAVSGAVGAVPEPASGLMLLAGLAGLVGIGRQRSMNRFAS